MYCLVVIDDYSRFTWVFFLATKDETSGILKSFITRIENLVDHKVKVIRCDNGTELKNREMNQFCEMRGILRQFSVAGTPQQNKVTGRRNRTLIEAARTTLANSKLPTTFWAETVNTACYVQNRVLIVKPHNKTPYEFFHGKTPTLSFMRPFGYPVTILNIIDHLGKFDGKANKGFFVGYSLNTKAFRVFNSSTSIVEENLHIKFSESTPNVVGSRPNWLFDIDALTRIMNYEPIVAGTQSNGFVGTKASDNADLNSSHDDGSKPSSDDGKKVDEDSRKDSECEDQGKEDNVNRTNNVNTAGNVNIVSSTVNTAGINKVIVVGGKISIELPFDLNMSALEDYSIFNFSRDDEDDGAAANMNNLDTTIQVSPNSTTRIHNDHPLDQEEPKVDLPNGKKEFVGSNGLFRIKKDEKGNLIEAIRLFLAYASFKDFMVYQMDVKSAFLYGKIEEEVYVCQPPGFEDPDFLNRVYKVEKALYGLHQALRAWYETLSTYMLDNGFQRRKIDKTIFIKRKLMHDKFLDEVYRRTFSLLRFTMKQKKDGIFISQDKYVEEILKKFGFTKVKTASTPMETQKPLLKDEDGEEVDVHMYRSMIGSLMYLTSSRPDIMFAVCACARYQVNPKVSHLHAVKRIFRYLKGQPKLGLWYPKDSPFDLVAYTDSDYARASLDRKSTTGGCQFLGCRLISWQCKKQTVVANSTTEAEYVAASSCCGQVKQRKVFKLMMEKLCDGIEVNAFNPKLKPRSKLSKKKRAGQRYDQDSAKWCCIQSSMLKHVIENGATLPKTTTVEGVVTVMPITTAEEKAQRRLEVKARSTLMMGAFQLNIYANGHVDYGVRRLLKTYRKDVTVNGLRLLVLIVLTEVLHLPQEGNFARSVELKKSRQTRTRIAQKEAEEGPNYALMAFSYDSEVIRQFKVVEEKSVKFISTIMGNPQMNLQGIKESNCSGMLKHMIMDMSYLTDYEEIDGGYVALKGTLQMRKVQENVHLNWLGHLNIKTMNKLVKGNLVRGLPSKLFENDQTCVACQKGKQHRASYKSKPQNSISLPLHLLHMDLFGPTFDETSGILKSFITGMENLVDHKVKVIRYDNETEFKNREMNQFYEMKGILRQFSVARTPQQNGVTKRRNMTPIEAVRTMLADSKLPTTFMRPFGCPVTILNTIDHLGKFNGKADEGFFVGYSLNSKAFRVFNSRTRIVEENLHIRFSESTPNVVGTKAINNAGQSRKETEHVIDYILLPLWTVDPPYSQDLKSSHDDGSKPSSDDGKKVDEDPRKDSECNDQEKEDNVNSTNTVNVVGTNEANAIGEKTSIELPFYPNIPSLEDYSIFDFSRDDGDDGAKEEPKKVIHALKDPSWIEDEKGIMIRNKARLIAQGYTQEEEIDYDEVFAPVARIEAIGLFLAYASFKDFVVYKIDVTSTFLYGKIEEEVYVCQPPGFEDLDFPDRVYKVEKHCMDYIKLLELDEAVHKELGDSLVRAATTDSSLEVEQDSGNITKWWSQKVLDLEKTKTTQANEIASLKRRAKKLEQKKRSRTHGLKRLRKAGATARVEYSGDEENLGEDASKQGRRINAIDADEDITLANDDADNEMFDVNALNGEEVFVAGQNENVVEEVVNATQDSTTVTTVTITTEEITLAQALEALKTSKPKVKGIVFQEPGKSTTTTTISSQQSQDKGKGIMIEEPVKPMKKKVQIMLDEEVALKLQAKFDEEERLAREKVEKEKEANVALIEEWDDIQAKIDADYQLAERLQAEEQEELSVEEKAKLFQQLLEQRRKHFAAKSAKEKRNKPPTQAQQRKIICTYLKNMEGKKPKDLKNKSFDSIQKMFNRAFKRQKVDEDKDTAELQSLMEVIPNEEEVAIDVVPLATKSPKMYTIFSQMLKSFNREDLEDLYKLSTFLDDAVYAYLHAGRKEIFSYTTYNYRYAEQEASVTVDLINVNATQSKVNAAGEEVSTAELVSTAYVNEVNVAEGVNALRSKLDEKRNPQGTPVTLTRYRSIVGSLMYSNIPDFVFVAACSARYQAKPTAKPLTTVKRVFRYLKGTINMDHTLEKLKSLAESDEE
ncbi:retrovirus-related pol polyprotein from transposon TNT 1-94 [Tanacetum coccineum]